MLWESALRDKLSGSTIVGQVSRNFVHLHVHSQFSFLVSSVKVKPLVARAAELQMPGLALTDHANLFGGIKFYTACKAAGITPILGCELNVLRDGTSEIDHLPILATNEQGYKNLIKMISLGYRDAAVPHAPSVTWDFLSQHTEGLVALSGCLGGVAAGRILEHGESGADHILGRLKDTFAPGHCFVELQNHGLIEQPVLNGILERAAGRLGLPLVATNDVHFLKREDGDAAFVLDCVRRGKRYEDELPHHHGRFEMYLKSRAEMEEVISNHSALDNTLLIREMCEGLELKLGTPMLPKFPIPEGFDTKGYFAHVSREGLEKRFQEFRDSGISFEESTYRERLERELGIINAMDYPGYFLIVWDFIREAKDRKIPVGPGRGSGAGSLVAYSMGITSIDPLPYNLLFERFLNPERVSMPDFDIDFCMDQREEVIRYVAEKYGMESVGQIATFQNLKARSVIKDVARSLGFSPPDAQRVASLIPDLGQGKTATISEALAMEPKLADMSKNDPKVADLLSKAERLEGLTRHAGMHAAGVVISDGPLYDFVPCFDNDDTFVTQYDKDDVEAAGLVKFDFLGLKTLTTIDIAQKLINARPDRKGKIFDIEKIPLDDQTTFQLVSTGDTIGVFQLESSGMQNLLQKLKPDCFEDIVAAVALYRPGPLGTGMIDDFIGGKHGTKPIRKLHPLVDDVLAPTYGVPVYQEQVMQIAQYLSGFSLGGADLLRRAMGKKKAEEMQKQQSLFVEGASKNGVDPAQSAAIFKEIEGFASYGFNKSHSAAYALITYQTAYLKNHYPVEFFAAVMTSDKDKIDKVVRTVAEARNWGVTVLAPDINSSHLDFTVVYSKPGTAPQAAKGKGATRMKDPLSPQIRFGLGAIRGVGASALDSVFESRDSDGPFADLFDMAGRVDSRRLNKGVLDSLICAGAFDTSIERLGIDRARAVGAIDLALERSRSSSRDRERGQESLFSMFEAAAGGGASDNADSYPKTDNWDRNETLEKEKDSLGCYVSGHPLDRYGDKLARFGTLGTELLSEQKPWSEVTIAGMVHSYQEKVFKGSGTKVAFFNLADRLGKIECKVKADKIEEFSSALGTGQPVLVRGKLNFPQRDDDDDGSERTPTLLVNAVDPLGEKVAELSRSVVLKLKAEQLDESRLNELKKVLELHEGRCSVRVELNLNEIGEAHMMVPMRVHPSPELLSGLERLFGDYVADLR